ncbi:MAG: hypothetical protein WC455_14500 [Dehalococcoidia bacterium]|jgi:hypothetical protein
MKRMTLIVLALVALSVLPPPLLAQSTAGLVTRFEITSTPIKELEFDVWASSGGTAYDTTSLKFSGRLISLHVDPTARTVYAPTDSFDVRVFDDLGYDILMGQGMNMDSSTVNYKLEANLGAVRNSTLRLLVQNAGLDGSIKIRLLIK